MSIMLSSLKDLVAGLRKKGPPVRRRLRVEPLESRTMLSAASMATLEFRADPPLLDSVAGFFDADNITQLMDAKQELQRHAATEQSKVFEQIALSRAELIALSRAELMADEPLSDIRATIKATSPRLQVPRNAHDQIKGAEDLSRANQKRLAAIEWPNPIAQIPLSPAVGGRDFFGNVKADGALSDLARLQITADHRLPTALVPPGNSEPFKQFNDGDLSRFLNQRHENLAGALGIDPLAYRANPGMEGGFVVIRRVGSDPNPRLAGDFLAVRERFVAPGTFTPPGELMILSDLSGSESTPLESSVSSTQRTSLGMSMLAPPEASSATNLASEGGFVTLTAPERVVLTDLSAGFPQSGEVNKLETKLSGPDSAGHTSINHLGGIRSSMLEDGTEGGLVDIDIVNETSPPMSTGAGYTPLFKPLWDSESRNSLGSVWRSFGDEDESPDAPRLAGDDDQPTNEPTDGSNQTQNAAPYYGSTFDSEEGGMVELVATGLTDAEMAYASTLSPGTDYQRPLTDGTKTQMDKGLGLFQAFELASVPGRLADASSLTVAGTNEPSPLARTTASDSKDDAPAPEESASAVEKSGELSDSRAAAMPAIVIAMMLTAVDVVREKGTSRNSEHRIDPI